MAAAPSGLPSSRLPTASAKWSIAPLVPTPKLLADGLQEGEGGWLLFEFLENAESLGDAWGAVQSLPVLAD